VSTAFYDVGYISSEFAFKKTSASRLSGDKQARLRLQMDPASEKTRSDGADVAGIPRYLRAARERALKLSSLAFQASTTKVYSHRETVGTQDTNIAN